MTPLEFTAPCTPALDHVEDWVFDLDNTLYPASTNLFAQVSRRMGEFIGETMDLDAEQARALQKRYFRDHGTTLRGLMTVDGIDPAAFLDYVHDIDLSMLEPSPALGRALDALPGRKLVFTNGTTAHATRILHRLGIDDRFEAVFDIVAADYRPKPQPEPYRAMLERFGLTPARTAMFEDMPQNLEPAHALGMTTVLIRTDAVPGAEAPADYIHHVADDLAALLTAIVRARDPDTVEPGRR